MTEKRLAMCCNAVGIFVPRFESELNKQAIITVSYPVSFLNPSKTKACVIVPNIDQSRPSPRFYTSIKNSRDPSTGVGYVCSCKRHDYGLFCDHMYRHVTSAGVCKIEEIVHERFLLEFYHSQYPETLPEYMIPTTQDLKEDKSLFLPTCSLPRAGRPKKQRYIGAREKAVKKFIKSLKTERNKNQKRNSGNSDNELKIVEGSNNNFRKRRAAKRVNKKKKLGKSNKRKCRSRSNTFKTKLSSKRYPAPFNTTEISNVSKRCCESAIRGGRTKLKTRVRIQGRGDDKIRVSKQNWLPNRKTNSAVRINDDVGRELGGLSSLPERISIRINKK